MTKLSHLTDTGDAQMVDVSPKAVTDRIATAHAKIRMASTTRELIESSSVAKGDVFAVARIAGIQAAKRTSDLIPLCHPLPISQITVDFSWNDAGELLVAGTCKVSGRTGVEMEAMTAVSVAALTVYDMCKAVDRSMRIVDVSLQSKSGGKSGSWSRP